MIDLEQYLPILLFLGVALAISCIFVFLPMGVSRLTGTHNPTAEKVSEYECGFPAFEEPRSQFDVRFYLVAILFILFDVELVFLYPWAVIYRELGLLGLVEMGVFLGILVVGFVYVWDNGALDWK